MSGVWRREKPRLSLPPQNLRRGCFENETMCELMMQGSSKNDNNGNIFERWKERKRKKKRVIP